MNTLLRLAALTGLLLVACRKEGPPPPGSSPQPTNASAAFEHPLNAPADYGRALVRAQTSAEKTVDLAALTKAIELFQVDKGRPPKDLDELVTAKYLRQLPPAPPGLKIVYDAPSGAVKVVKP